jgi:hypothetical protein
MADVFQKIIPANDVVNGGVVVGADMLGNYYTTAPKLNQSDIVAQSGRLSDPKRFDDYTYYSA